MLFPHLVGLQVARVFVSGVTLRIEVQATGDGARCPVCGGVSSRVHSRYQRRLSDLAVSGRPVLLHVKVRRFVCMASACPRKTFAESFPHLTGRYKRSTHALQTMLRSLGLALGGRPGARLSGGLGVPTSRMTLLRAIDALAVPEPSSVRVLGVDDFAFRRGHNYGTVLIDMDTRRPVELLPDRTAESFAEWLRAHPGTEVICRDRASGYAEGAREGAPGAIQVADRWHLLHNLSDAVNRVARAHRSCLKDPTERAEDRSPGTPTADKTPEEIALGIGQAAPTVGRREANTRRRHAEIHELLARGVRLKSISRTLELDVKTVRRYARAATPDELLTPNPTRGTQLDQHLPFLTWRWQEGCENAGRLTRELRDRGYRGSERSVRRLLQTWRTSTTLPDASPAAPSPRQITGWIMRPDHKQTDDDRSGLAVVLDRCTTLRTVHQLACELGPLRRTLTVWGQ
ncbi:ISL3 family transposase [Pseudonocardia sp. NPDC049154]|uniref:ISL3 family transposase n=1 Tax=Pseudonocardia sp. NPDC049154 TaxID=3155501 RepID=UPI0033E1B2E1